MIKFKLNGKPFNPRTFEEILMNGVAEKMREKIGSIRHPDTGEFPTIVITGTSLSNMRLRIEGSPELIALIEQKTGAVTQTTVGSDEMGGRITPKVFLSYAWEDRAVAERVASSLQANGIDTWWAEWCMSAGDSLRQKIDEGLSDCSHFIVLLTPVALSKPWVNQEMDAGLMLKLQEKVKFIPLRYRLTADQLPPLLRGTLSPAVEDPDYDIGQLISDIHGALKKPPLGKAPAYMQEVEASTGYSAAATAIAKVFVESTKNARKFDPTYSIENLVGQTGLSAEDVEDALHELSGLVVADPRKPAYPEDELFVTFDRFWMEWDPADDGLKIARDMLNDAAFPTAPAQIGQSYNWEPRRLNPAMAYLINRNVVQSLKALDGGPWLVVLIKKTDATRRFVKSRP